MKKAKEKHAKKHALTPEMEKNKWQPGESGNSAGRPKGLRNFETDFRLACKEVGEALRLGKDPDKVKIELIKRGIKEGLQGNFPFWKEIMERNYGKVIGDEVGDKTLILIDARKYTNIVRREAEFLEEGRQKKAD